MGGSSVLKMKKSLIGILVIVFSLMIASTAIAGPTKTEGTMTQVQPNAVGGNWVGAYIDHSGPTIWYSGNMSSANAWISASNQVSLQWQSPLGGSWLTEETQSAVYSSNTTQMSTPTYLFYNATWGYWRAKNYFVAYWPSNIIPSYLNGNAYSSKFYLEEY